MKDRLDSDDLQNPSPSTIRRVHVFVSGRVQGVFFRAETRRQASKLGLAGWVRNREDRRVEAVFEGEKTAVGQMLGWCRKGPALSRVTGVEVIEEPPAGDLAGFRIRY
jgi:acylphosphatase